MMNCPICKGNIVKVDKGERCTKCGEEFVDEKEGQKMIAVAKKLGIWSEPLKLHRKR